MSAEAQKPRYFSALFDFIFKSSIGMKVVMAASGVILWGFVIGHMAGNLQIFLPTAAGEWGKVLNDYAHTLKTTPPLLWGTRITLLVAFILHAYTGVKLAAANKAARPVRYGAPQAHETSTLAGRIMPITGIILLVFIIGHLLHFTIPSFNKAAMAYTFKGDHDVARMVVEAFSKPLVVLVYVIGTTGVVLHLFHGSKSFLQSLGLRHAAWTPGIALVGRLTVAAILVGNMTIPGVIFMWSQQSPSWFNSTRGKSVASSTATPTKTKKSTRGQVKRAPLGKQRQRIGKKGAKPIKTLTLPVNEANRRLKAGSLKKINKDK